MSAPRDANGISFDAPAWTGDLASLTDEQLRQRINGLTTYVGNLTSVYRTDGTWRAASAVDLKARDFDHWVRVRLDALTEDERRRA